MQKLLVKARKLGGSLIVTIPSEVVEVENIHPNDVVSVEIKKEKRSWFGAFPGLSPFTKEDELDEQIRG